MSVYLFDHTYNNDSLWNSVLQQICLQNSITYHPCGVDVPSDITQFPIYENDEAIIFIHTTNQFRWLKYISNEDVTGNIIFVRSGGDTTYVDITCLDEKQQMRIHVVSLGPNEFNKNQFVYCFFRTIKSGAPDYKLLTYSPNIRQLSNYYLKAKNNLDISAALSRDAYCEYNKAAEFLNKIDIKIDVGNAIDINLAKQIIDELSR